MRAIFNLKDYRLNANAMDLRANANFISRLLLINYLAHQLTCALAGESSKTTLAASKTLNNWVATNGDSIH